MEPKRFPIPVAPPLLAPVDALQTWFAALRELELQVARHAGALALPYFTRAGIEPYPRMLDAITWESFAFYLNISLGPALAQKPVPAWVAVLLAELMDFARANPNGSGETRPAHLILPFTNRQDYRALFPPGIEGALVLIGDGADVDRERENMMSW